MVRKATLGNKAAQELRARIDCALLPETRRRLNHAAVDFLISIRRQITASVVRLSKKQRDVTEEILAKAFSDQPVVVLEGQSLDDLGKLFSHATADARVSALGEHVLLSLKDRLKELPTDDSGERTMAVSPKQWRIVEEIIQKTYFGQPAEPPPIDPDGLVENEDLDGLSPERVETDVDDRSQDWAIVGIDVDVDEE
jgi:hypothetical protein